MNIIVISNAVWDDNNSLGNTLSNWFSGWEDCNFSCITYRSDIPNNKCCNNYYVVPPFEIVKNIFTPGKIGLRYNSNSIPTGFNKIEVGAKGITGIKRSIIGTAIDFIYQLPLWRNARYKQFIRDINPEIIFLFAIADSFVYENVKYLKKHTKAKIIVSVEDDVYGAVAEKKGILPIIKKNRLKSLIQIADKLYGASQLMCEAYSKQFNREFFTIYKGCEFQGIKQKVNNPIEIVYAGNLLYGRLDTLSEIANAIREINRNGLIMRLSIYSGTKVSDDAILCINDGKSAIFCGLKPFEEIKNILNKSDITLHVESFLPEMQKLVRYSFSTKIIDCLQSGNTMMVVGPKNIASVEYPRSIPGAIVVDNTDKLYDVFNNIARTPKALLESAKSINQYAKEHHDIKNVRERLRRDFEILLKSY